jgi:hypothetical protein
VFTGRRGAESGSVENLCEAIHTFRRRVEETNARNSTAFIETRLFRQIEKICRYTFENKRISFIFGRTQTGKSRNTNEYARRHNHGETKYFRVPAGGNFRDFLMEMAEVLGLSGGMKSYELQRRIMNCFDERTLLMVDELEQCLESKSGMRILDSSARFGTGAKCGVVGIGAPSFRRALSQSTGLNETLGKFAGRGVRTIILPSLPPAADLNAFADAFGLPPAEDKEIKFKFRFWIWNPARTNQDLRRQPVPDSIHHREGLRSGAAGSPLSKTPPLSPKKTRKPIAWHHVHRRPPHLQPGQL